MVVMHIDAAAFRRRFVYELPENVLHGQRRRSRDAKGFQNIPAGDVAPAKILVIHITPEKV
jgi:hypothetical protein